jgi:phytoene dehydrogenase-like protein
MEMKKMIIIGGGIAGLSTGCYAKMNGYDVHIYEMGALPGGLCTSWKNKGYTFDICVHWLVGSSPDSRFHQIWRELGTIQGKEIYYKETAVKYHLEDQTVCFYSDPERLAEHLKGISPEDGAAIDELVDYVRIFYRLMDTPLTKPKELFTPLDNIKMMKRYAPFIKPLKQISEMTIDDFSEKFKNPLLRRALKAFKTNSPANAFFAVPFVLATKNSGFPAGGSLEFARGIEKRFTGLGGKIHYGAKIRKILVTDNKAVGVRLENGEEVAADIVVSAADGHSTIFKMLDGKFIDKKIENCYENVPVIPSWLQVSIGVDMDLSEKIDINSIYNVYELGKPLTIAGKEKQYATIKNYAFDPSFAPKGKSSIAVVFFSDSAYWEKLYQDKEKYKQEKKNVEKTVVNCLETLMPGIKEKIETVDVATPMTIIRYTNNWQGSIMGFVNPFRLDIPRTLPGLKNFYMAGQWVGGSGLPGAASSGREIVHYICHNDKRKFITAMP